MKHGEQVVARLFELSEFRKAVDHKEATGGLLFRVKYQERSMYEVRYLPPPSKPATISGHIMSIYLNIALRHWPYEVHKFTGLCRK